MKDVRRCPNSGRPMVVELSGKAVGSSKGEAVRLWYCERCDHAEHEVRPCLHNFIAGSSDPGAHAIPCARLLDAAPLATVGITARSYLAIRQDAPLPDRREAT